MSVESFTSNDANSASVAICKRYELALLAAFQLNVSDVGWLIACGVGFTNVGTDGTEIIVVKLVADVNAVVP